MPFPVITYCRNLAYLLYVSDSIKLFIKSILFEIIILLSALKSLNLEEWSNAYIFTCNDSELFDILNIIIRKTKLYKMI